MVTGDKPGTARAIATKVGMQTEPTVTGPQLAEADPSDRNAYWHRPPLLARVDPETKFALIDALHERGEVVAMTGDGLKSRETTKP